MNSTAYDYRIEIQKLQDLPPLPLIANELLAKLNDSDADIDDISAIIIRDPGLTAKLLSLANSAFFGFGRRVETISAAIINVLGLEIVKSLSIGLIMSGSFDTKKCRRFELGQYWASALLTAELVKSMNKLHAVDANVTPCFYYLYGLLHNLGILVLADRFPQEMDIVFAEKEKNPDKHLLDIEDQTLGINHMTAAAYLGIRWNLPEDIVTVMSHYRDPAYQEDYWKVCKLTGLCANQTKKWLTGNTENNLETESLIELGYEVDSVESVHEDVKSKLDDVNTLAGQMST